MLENLDEIYKNINANKTADHVTIVCATKTVSADKINQLPSNNLFIAGENRVQEFLEKVDCVTGVKWHIIGRLQTNKVKYVVGKVDLIESVDRVELVDEIEKQSAKKKVKTNVLVQINGGNEENKGGVDVENLKEMLDYVKSKENIELKGLMSVFPKDAPCELYAKVKNAYDKYKDEYSLTILSMGMSNDYVTAVRNGATQVRLGSVLFGKRGGYTNE